MVDQTTYDYNLIVIGGGPAGEKGAAQVAYFGMQDSVIPKSCGNRTQADFKVALIEKGEHLGGACINTGTLPSKTLRESALFLSGAKTRQLSGGVDTVVKRNISLSDFMARASYVTQSERERARNNMARQGVKVIRGEATLLDKHSVKVRSPEGREDIISAEFILLATGSSPARPSFIPFDSENIFDSDTILTMRHIPTSLLVVGGGVIGCEYACLFQALGVNVTLLNRSARILEFLDSELSDSLMRSSRAAGMTLLLNEDLESVTLKGGVVRTLTKSGKEIVTDSLLYAAGRGGNSKGLGLEALGIPIGRFGNIENTNPRTYQTTVPNIYAVGDLIGRPALASTSMEQGRLAMCHAFNIRYRDQDLTPILPSGIYTIPEISSVGEGENHVLSRTGSEASYVVGRSRFGDHARGKIIGDNEGFIKLIFSVPERKLLGCHVIGENASELVHIGLACLHFGGDINFFLETVFNYPTLSDVFKYAAYDALIALNRRGLMR